MRDLPVREIVQLYEEGTSEAELARRYSCSRGAIRKRLEQSGVHIRRHKMLPRVPMNKEDVIKSYLNGEGLRALSRRYLVHSQVIKNILVDAGVHRTHSEAQYMRWEKSTPEQLRQRGIKHAQTVQEKCKLSEIERQVLQAFEEAGIKTVPQYALDIFNLDFAIPQIKLAIEIDSRWHGYSNVKEKDERKNAFLKQAGWSLLRVRVPKKGLDLDKVVRTVKTRL